MTRNDTLDIDTAVNVLQVQVATTGASELLYGRGPGVALPGGPARGGFQVDDVATGVLAKAPDLTTETAQHVVHRTSVGDELAGRGKK